MKNGRYRSKRKAAETAATVRRHTAFRKTQTSSANSLTRRHSERKKNSMSEFHKGGSACRFYQMSNAIFCYDLKPIPLAVYSYLACCAGQKELCWPSIKTIALQLFRKCSAGCG